MYGTFRVPVAQTTLQQDKDIARNITATKDDVNGKYVSGEELIRVLDTVTNSITYVKANDGTPLARAEVNLEDFKVATPTGLISFPEVEVLTLTSGPATLEEMLTSVSATIPTGATYCDVAIPFDRINGTQDTVDVSRLGFANGALGVPQSEPFAISIADWATTKIVGFSAVIGLPVRLVLNFYNQDPKN